MAKKKATTTKPPTSRPPARKKKAAAKKKAATKKKTPAARSKAAAPVKNTTPKPPAKRSATRKKKAATKAKPGRRATKPADGAEPSIEQLRAVREQSKADAKKAAYQRHQERNRASQAEQVKAGRELGPMPKPVDPKRRESCRPDVQKFAHTYFPNLFRLKSSPSHERVWQQIQAAVLEGGLFAMAMPRASGKTTMCIVAIIWATVYSHRRFSVLVGSTQGKAEKLMKILKRFLSLPGGAFADDFPEVVIPCAELENKGNRCNGQLCGGEQTRIEWNADQVVLPTVRDTDGTTSECSGSIIATAGLLGEIRGMLYVDSDGNLIRPTFVLLDDPQTKKSASSVTETTFRMEVVDEDVLGLVGPDQTLAVVMPCTVICPDDLADQLLDPERNPDWQSERIPMLLSLPDKSALDLWDEYRELLIEARQTRSYKRANKFYQSNRKAMEAGCEHYWPHRIPEGYKGISAIQFAMDWMLTRPKSFWSECQQNPLGDADPDADLLTVEEIVHKQHGTPEGVAPNESQVVTAFVDVQHHLLYYCVIAWNPKRFTGYVLEYGAWPQQKTRNFQYAHARRKLTDHYRGQRGARLGLENLIRLGVTDLLDYLLHKDFNTAAGVVLRVQRLAVDCSDQSDHLRDIIAEYNSPLVLAAFGRDKPLTGKPERTDKSGDRWRSRINPKFKLRQLTYQPNHWKRFFHARLSTDFGEPGSVSLFQDDAYRHQTFAENLRAEKRSIFNVEGPDGIEEQHRFTCPPGIDNHWFDCAVGATVLAAHEGCQLWSRASTQQPATNKVKLSELRRQRQGV